MANITNAQRFKTIQQKFSRCSANAKNCLRRLFTKNKIEDRKDIECAYEKIRQPVP